MSNIYSFQNQPVLFNNTITNSISSGTNLTLTNANTTSETHISSLQPSLNTSQNTQILLGRANTSNNSAFINFSYLGASSATNKLTLGLNSQTGLTIDGNNNLVVPGTITSSITTGTNLTLTNTASSSQIPLSILQPSLTVGATSQILLGISNTTNLGGNIIFTNVNAGTPALNTMSLGLVGGTGNLSINGNGVVIISKPTQNALFINSNWGSSFTISDNSIYTLGGIGVTGPSLFSSTSESTTFQSGAIVVAGGVGIGRRLNVAGAVGLSGTGHVSSVNCSFYVLPTATPATAGTSVFFSAFNTPSLTLATGAVTNAYTVHINGAPTISGGGLITNSYSLFVNGGQSYFGGNVSITNTSASITLRSAAESQSVFLYMSNPFNTSAVNKTAIISEGITNFSKSKIHFCLNNVNDNTTAVSVSDARLTVDTNGNVGIGITTPTTRLDIGSDASQFNAVLNITESTHASSKRAAINLGTGWGIGQDINGNGTKDFFIYGGSTPSTKLSISLLGNVNINATTASTSTTTGALIVAGGIGIGGMTFSNQNIGAPTLNTRSTGTKHVLFNSLTVSELDYALGIEGSNMWFSSGGGISGGFKWYNNSIIPSMLLGGTASGSSSVGLVIQRANATRLEIANIGADGNYSTSAIVGDGVIRIFAGNLILQSGAGAAAIKINSFNNVEILPTTASTSTTTGALIVSGGVGIAKQLFVGDGIRLVNSINDITAVTRINSSGNMVNSLTAGNSVLTSMKVMNKRIRTSYANANNAITTWYSRTSAVDNSWNSVCWSAELSIFVAVALSGTNNRVMTSPDGITWTSQSSPFNNWRSVCWSAELSIFVAVPTAGAGAVLMTSPNGINWTSRTSAADINWYGICWSAELSIFVAVSITGTGNRVMTSLDGITWTSRNAATENQWASVCWSAELSIFVAVSGNGTGNRVMTSPDGINWTSRTSAADNFWSSVCWSAELSIFVAVSNTGTGNRVMTSPDGITWTSRTSAVDNSWNSVCWSAELSIFVAVSNTGTGNRVMTSNIGLPASKSALLVNPSHMSVNNSNGSVNINSILNIANGQTLNVGTSGVTSQLNVYGRTLLLGSGSSLGSAALLSITPDVTNITGASAFFSYFASPAMTGTITNAYTMYIEDAPTGGTITNRYSLFVNGGLSYFGGTTFSNQNTGTPTFTTRSTGTKYVLFNNLSGSLLDYALGIESGNMWFSSGGGTSNGFKWYNNSTTPSMNLTGAGNIRLGPTSGDSNVDYFISTTGQLTISANDASSQDANFVFLNLTSGVSTNQSRINISGSSSSSFQHITFSTLNTERMRIESTGVVNITATTASTSTTTGALTVTGGVGVGGNVTTGGTILNTNGRGILYQSGSVVSYATNCNGLATTNTSGTGTLDLASITYSAKNTTNVLLITAHVSCERTTGTTANYIVANIRANGIDQQSINNGLCFNINNGARDSGSAQNTYIPGTVSPVTYSIRLNLANTGSNVFSIYTYTLTIQELAS